METLKGGCDIVNQVTIPRMSNFHAHLRRDAMMRAVARHIMRHPRYLLVMPNTGPIRTIEEAETYYDELLTIAAEEIDHPIELIMTLYHTDLVTPAVIERIAASDIVRAVKHYPPHPGATTGSGHGIPLEASHEMLRAMEVTGVPLLGHFESVHENGREIPHEMREAHMVETVLWRLRDQYPNLRICFEHASTKEAVTWTKADESGNSVMTVTPQHSLFIQPDFHELGTDLKCMPIVKSEEDRAAIVDFMTSGDSRAIAGDDVAPHPHKTKRMPFAEAANGCFLPHALELYAQVFDQAGALKSDSFERFMSLNGPRWWKLPAPDPSDTITLVRRTSAVPNPVPVPELEDIVVPLGWSPDGSKMQLQWAVA